MLSVPLLKRWNYGSNFSLAFKDKNRIENRRRDPWKFVTPSLLTPIIFKGEETRKKKLGGTNGSWRMERKKIKGFWKFEKRILKPCSFVYFFNEE